MQFDGLTLFGLLSLSAMLAFYALYGFLQGAWPFGVLELIWAGIASKRWLALKQTSSLA